MSCKYIERKMAQFVSHHYNKVEYALLMAILNGHHTKNLRTEEPSRCDGELVTMIMDNNKLVEKVVTPIIILK